MKHALIRRLPQYGHNPFLDQLGIRMKSLRVQLGQSRFGIIIRSIRVRVMMIVEYGLVVDSIEDGPLCRNIEVANVNDSICPAIRGLRSKLLAVDPQQSWYQYAHTADTRE